MSKFFPLLQIGIQVSAKAHAAVCSQIYDALEQKFCTKLAKECVVRIQQVCQSPKRTTVSQKWYSLCILCWPSFVKGHAPKFSLLHPTPLP